MRLSHLMFCLAIACMFALSACGGGNDTNSSMSDKDDDKPKSAADLRQETLNKMVAAFGSLDADALKAVWLPAEHEKLQKRVLKEFPEFKEGGGSWVVKPSAIVEKDGKFTFTSTMSIKPMKDGPAEEEKDRPGALIEHEGKWYISFGD